MLVGLLGQWVGAGLLANGDGHGKWSGGGSNGGRGVGI